MKYYLYSVKDKNKKTIYRSVLYKNAKQQMKFAGSRIRAKKIPILHYFFRKTFID